MVVVRSLLVLAMIIMVVGILRSLVVAGPPLPFYLYSMGGIFVCLGLLHIAFPVELREEARLVWQGFIPGVPVVRIVGLLLILAGAGMVAVQVLHPLP